MKRLTVGVAGRPYDIVIEQGLLQNLAPLFAPFAAKQKVIITDSNVAPLYAGVVASQLGAPVVTVDAGEGSKSLATLEAVYEKLIALGLTRSGMLVALGGGVVGDLTGFCASTLFRGVDYAAIPTTLLAQVDSSVGGKTAVNLPAGKNLAGTFYQPKLVAVDPGVLKTLNGREFACGMAEVIKYGAIGDAGLFEALFGDFDMETVIETCCRIKAGIVARDEFDTGERMLLNFGHTIGHAIEKVMGFGTLSHGAAVAAGMCAMTRYSEKAGITGTGTAQRLMDLCEKFDLPTTVSPSEKEALLSAMGHDKKADGEKICVVLLREIGKSFYEKVEKARLSEILDKGLMA